MKVSDRWRSGRREIFNTLSRKYVVVLKKKKKGGKPTYLVGHTFNTLASLSIYPRFSPSVSDRDTRKSCDRSCETNCKSASENVEQSVCMHENARPVAAVSVVTFSPVTRDTNGVVSQGKGNLAHLSISLPSSDSTSDC